MQFRVAAVALLITVSLRAAVPPETVSLAGAIDFHCHSGPDTAPRSVNSFEAVRQARAAGMRGLVLKNHFMSTASLAQLAMEEVGGIEVFGGLVLNRAAGGINAEAVRRMIQIEGRRGRVLWLPTFDAESQVKLSGESRPFVSVVKDGRPVPALAEVFQLAAENDLVLATGHSAPEESLILLEAARAAGVKRLLVTHVFTQRVRVSIEQMKRMATLGAVMECIWYVHMASPSARVTRQPPVVPIPIADAVRAIQTVGAEHFLISSDLGQAGAPIHTVGLQSFVALLRDGGLSQREIDLVLNHNPARLLGLER